MDLRVGNDQAGEQGQQDTLNRVLAERGSCPAAPKDCRYAWAYLFGAICPARGTGGALVLPSANAAMMNLHLVEIGTAVAPGAQACASSTAQAGTRPAAACTCQTTSLCCPRRPIAPN